SRGFHYPQSPVYSSSREPKFLLSFQVDGRMRLAAVKSCARKTARFLLRADPGRGTMIQPFSSTGDEPFRPESGTSAHWLLSLPVRLEAWLGLTECDSSFGPLICLQTSLLLSSLRARLTFAERPDAASRVSTLEVPLLSAAQRLPSPRQIVRATRPRPELQLMVCDESGE